MQTPQLSIAAGKTEVRGRPRPALFRALGIDNPPDNIVVEERTFRHVRTFKHDSWAATALYVSDGRWIVCKFNRRQSIFGLPMLWLGRLLARREARFLELLADLPSIPATCGPVRCQGQILPNAVAHRYVPGLPLRPSAAVGDDFFSALREVLDELHRRGIAYIDLHKLENVIVGSDGRPYLIDFQISLRLPQCWPFSPLQRILRESDLYHWQKHVSRLRPDLCDCRDTNLQTRMPWWIRLHRRFAVPFRQVRRRLLVLWGIRREAGSARTEHCPEEAFRIRPEMASLAP